MRTLAIALLLTATLAGTLRAQAPPTQWVERGGDARDVAVTPSGEAWVLDASGGVWRLRPMQDADDMPSWNRMPGQFARLRATLDGQLWGVTLDRRLYRLVGSVWRPVREQVVDVAAAPDGETWVLDAAAAALLRLADGAAFEPAPSADAKRALALVSDPHGLPWIVHEDGRVQRFGGRSWSFVASPEGDALLDVAIGPDGSVIGLGSSGRLSRLRADTGRWEAFSPPGTPGVRAVAVEGPGLPWIVASSGAVLASRFERAPEALPPPPAVFTRLLSWRPVGGKARAVSVGADGTVFGLDPDGHPWTLGDERAAWRPIGTERFTAIVAGSGGGAWALDEKKRVHQLTPAGWTLLPVTAEALAAGRDDALWGLQPDRRIARWDASAQRWKHVRDAPKRAAALVIGPRDLPWVIDGDGTVRVAEGRGSWKALSGITAQSLGVGSEGTVYAVDRDGAIHWLDLRESAWKPATGKASVIAVGRGGAPWAVAPDGQLLASTRFLEEQDARRQAAEIAAAASRQPEIVVIPGWPLPSSNKPLSYQLVPGDARLRDLAIGAEGSIYAVGGSGEFYCFSTPELRFVQISRGKNARVGVSTAGAPWLVTSDGVVSRFDRGVWKPVPEFSAQDVAGGPDGSVWAVGVDGESYRFDARSERFQRQPVTASDKPFKHARIAPANAGVYYAVTTERQLVRCEKGSCRLALLAATDVAVAPDNIAFALDAMGAVQRFNPRSKAFEKQNGVGIALAVGPQGLPWLVQTDGRVQYAGLVLPRAKNLNGANCAAAFSQAPTPSAVPASGIKAADDVVTVDPGDAFSVLANDRTAARPPTLADVSIDFDPGNSGLALEGENVIVPLDAQPGSVLGARYRLCPRKGFDPCSDARITLTVGGQQGPPPAPSTPAAPQDVAAAAGNAQAIVSFRSPPDTGGLPIVSYTVVSTPGGLEATGPGSPIVLGGLTNGVRYTFTVKARNAIGDGPASAPTDAVVPRGNVTPPAAPVNVRAVAGDAQATISFSPPSNSGGAPIASYTVLSNPGNLTAAGTGSPITITGLSNGVRYSFIVTATNGSGEGPASNPSNSVIPRP